MASFGIQNLASLMLIMFMAATIAPEAADAAVTCNNVLSYLMPCISYVQNGGQPAAACCNGVKTLYGQTQTSTDRRNVCNCIKSAVNGIPYSSINLDNAASLLDKCNLHIPYKISPTTDCNKVQ